MNTRINVRRIAFVVSLGATILFGSAARADSLDAAFDAEFGLPSTVDTTPAPETTPAPQRDPASVGTRLPGRASVDMRMADDDEGHRIDITPPPAPTRHHSHRHGRRNVVASR